MKKIFLDNCDLSYIAGEAAKIFWSKKELYGHVWHQKRKRTSEMKKEFPKQEKEDFLQIFLDLFEKEFHGLVRSIVPRKVHSMTENVRHKGEK